MIKSGERRRKEKMLKVVVFDSGFGGELFADLLEEELPILEVIRVIDWRHADQILKSAKTARLAAVEALRPYIGTVDLIVFANHLLTLTSINYFRQKYKNQKFIGFNLKNPDTFVDQKLLILTTSAVAHLLKYHKFIHQLKRQVTTLTVDDWPAKIDDGELSADEIRATISRFTIAKNYNPSGVILACAQLNDIIVDLEKAFPQKVRFHSSFDDTFRDVCKVLRIRGGLRKIVKS